MEMIVSLFIPGAHTATIFAIMKLLIFPDINYASALYRYRMWSRRCSS